MSEKRNINEGLFGWYEKGAMKLIEDELPFKQQATCKLVYIAICSMSAKQKNSAEIECFKFDIARFASVSEKTVQRCLPMLEVLHILCTIPQDRLANGKYGKLKIRLVKANLTAGQLGDSTETAEGLNCPIYIKKERKKEILKKIVKEKNPEQPKKKRVVETLDDMISSALTRDPSFRKFDEILTRFKMRNQVNPESFSAIYEKFRHRLPWVEQIEKMCVWHKDCKVPKTEIITKTLQNWFVMAEKIQKADESKRQEKFADRSARTGYVRNTGSILPSGVDLSGVIKAKTWD